MVEVDAPWEDVTGLLDAKTRLDRAAHTATVVGHKILVVGGRRGHHFYNDYLWYDTHTKQWSSPSRLPFKGRASHAAVLVGRCVWIIGGCGPEDVCGDAYVLNLDTLKWHRAHISRGEELLARSAHAAEVHPSDPSAILLFGGYGHPPGGSDDYTFLSDVLLLYTERGVVERMITSGPVPSPRGYHTATILGERLYVFGGRTVEGIVTDSSVFAVLDCRNMTWLPPQQLQLAGSSPCPRSSHKAVACGSSCIVLFGGAGAEGTQRLNDLQLLLVAPGAGTGGGARGGAAAGGGGGPCCCKWVSAGNQPVTGRSAQSMVLIGSSLYVMGGYAGSASGSTKYHKDCWRTDVSWIEAAAAAAGAGAGTAAAGGPWGVAAQQGQPGRLGGQLPLEPGGGPHGGQGWVGHKRTLAAANQAPAGAIKMTGAAGAAGAGAGVLQATAAAAAAAPAAAGTASTWHSAKRQRSGGASTKQPHPPQQQQQARQVSPLPQQQQQQQQGEGLVPSPFSARGPAGLGTVPTAAAAAVGGRRKACPRCDGCELDGQHLPSPSRASMQEYGHEVFRLQLEVDNLRNLLTKTDRSRSNTEGQLEQCRQQLAEVGREKQGLCKKLEEQQQQLLSQQLEANNCRCNLEREVAARQAAEAARDEAVRLHREAEAKVAAQATSQQSARGEIRKLQNLLGEKEKDKQRADQQLRAEQEAKRKALESADGLRAELDAARGKMVGLEEQRLKLTTELSAEKEDKDRRLKEAAASARQLQQEKQQLADALAVAERQGERAQAEAAAAQRQLDQQQAALQKLMGEHEALKANSLAAETRSQQEKQALQRQLDQMRQQKEELHSKNSKLADGWAQESTLISQVKGLVQQLASHHEAFAST